MGVVLGAWVLLVAVVAFQVYRGVVAFRDPDRELPPPPRVSPLVWFLVLVGLMLLVVAFAFVGARVYR